MNKKNQLPLVSIIVPCYNSENHIKSCVNSILSQDYENIEIVIVNDGSTDNSLSLLNEYSNDPKVKVLNQANSGACVARNRALSECTGIYVKFLDSDDELEPGIIRKQVDLSKRYDRYTIIYGDMYINRLGKKHLHSTNLPLLDQVSSLFLNDIFISTPLHYRWMLEKVGGFDERFKNGQEWNLHVRLASYGFKFQHHQDPVFTYRIHNSKSRISNGKNSLYEKAKYDLEKIEMTVEKLGDKIGATFNSALSMKYIWIARTMLRAGKIKESTKVYKRAISLTEDYSLYWPDYYRRLYNLFGFYFSEIPISIAIKIRGSKFKL